MILQNNTNMFHQQITAILLFCLLSLANGNEYGSSKYSNTKYYSPYYPSCKPFENKIYQLTVTFPGAVPLYAGLRLLPNGMFDEIFSIANGNNAAEVGANFALSNRYGYYKCLSNNQMRLTGYGFLYKTADVPFLATNGADVTHDYRFQFDSTGRTLTGKVRFGVYTAGSDPFDTNNVAVFPGPIGDVKGELLKFRARYDLDG